MEPTHERHLAASKGGECDSDLLLSVVQVPENDGHAPYARLCTSRYLHGPEGGARVTLCSVEDRLELTMEGPATRSHDLERLPESTESKKSTWDVPWEVSEIVGLGFFQLDKERPTTSTPSQDLNRSQWSTWEEEGDTSHVELDGEDEDSQPERADVKLSAGWEDVLVVAVHRRGKLYLAHLGTFPPFFQKEGDSKAEEMRIGWSGLFTAVVDCQGLVHAATDGNRHLAAMDTHGNILLWKINTDAPMHSESARRIGKQCMKMLGKGRVASPFEREKSCVDVVQMDVQEDKVVCILQSGYICVVRLGCTLVEDNNVDVSKGLEAAAKVLEVVDLAPRLRWALGAKSDTFSGCMWAHASKRDRSYDTVVQGSGKGYSLLVSSLNGKIALVQLHERSSLLHVKTVKTINSEISSLRRGRMRMIEAVNKSGHTVAKLRLRSSKQVESARVALLAKEACCSVKERFEVIQDILNVALDKTQRDLPLIAKVDRTGNMLREKLWRRAKRRIALLKRRWLLETFLAINQQAGHPKVSLGCFDPLAFEAFCDLCSGPNGIGDALFTLASLGEVHACEVLLHARGGSPRSSVAKALLALPPTFKSAELIRLAVEAPPQQSSDACEESPSIVSRLHALLEVGGACASEARALVSFSLPLSRALGLEVCVGVHSMWIEWLKARIMAVEASTGDVDLAVQELRTCHSVLANEGIQGGKTATLEMDQLDTQLCMLKALRAPRDGGWIRPSTYSSVLEAIQQEESQHGVSDHEGGSSGQLFFSTDSELEIWTLPLLQLAKMSSSSWVLLLMCHGSEACLRQAAAILQNEVLGISVLKDYLAIIATSCSSDTAVWCGKALCRLRLSMLEQQRLNPLSLKNDGGSEGNNSAVDAQSICSLSDVLSEQIVSAIVHKPSQAGWDNAKLFVEAAWPPSQQAHKLQTIVHLGAAMARTGTFLELSVADQIHSNPLTAVNFLETVFMDETSPHASKWLKRWLDVAPVRELCDESDLPSIAEVFVKVGAQKSMELVELLVAQKSKNTSAILSLHEEAALKAVTNILEDRPSSRARALVEAAQTIAYAAGAPSDRLLHARSILRVVLDSVASQVDVGGELGFWCGLAKEEFSMLEALCVILPKAGVRVSPSAWKDLQNQALQKSREDTSAYALAAISILASYAPKAGVEVLHAAACCLGLVSESCTEVELARAIRLYVARRDSDPLAAAALVREGYTPAWELCLQFAQAGQFGNSSELAALAVAACPTCKLQHSLEVLRSSVAGKYSVQNDLRRSDGPATITLMKLCKETPLDQADSIHAHAAAMCAEYASEVSPRSPPARARQHWALRVCALGAVMMSAGEAGSPNQVYQDLMYKAPEDAASLMHSEGGDSFYLCAQALGTASVDSARARYEAASADAQAVSAARQLAAQKLADIGAQDRLKGALPADLLHCVDSILQGTGELVDLQRAKSLNALAAEGARLLAANEDAACARILADAGEFAASWGMSTVHLVANFAIESVRLQDSVALDAVLAHMEGLLGSGDLNSWKSCALILSEEALSEGSDQACKFRFQLAAESAFRAQDESLHDRWSLAVHLTDLCMTSPELEVSSLLGLPVVPSRINRALVKCRSVELASKAVEDLRKYFRDERKDVLDDVMLPSEVHQVYFWAAMVSSGDRDEDLKNCVTKYAASKAYLKDMDIDSMAEAVMVQVRRSPLPAKLSPLVPDGKDLCHLSHSLTRAILADALCLVGERGKELPAYSKLCDALWEEKAKCLDRALRASNGDRVRQLLREGEEANMDVSIEGHKDSIEHWLLARPFALSQRLRSGGLARLSGANHAGLSLALESLVLAEQHAGNKHAADVATLWLKATNIAPVDVDLRALSGGRLCVEEVQDAQLACKEIFDKVSTANASVLASMLDHLYSANLPVPRPSCVHLSLAWKLAVEGAPTSAIVEPLQRIQWWEQSAFSLAVTWSSAAIGPEDGSAHIAPDPLEIDTYNRDLICKELWFNSKQLEVRLAASYFACFFVELIPASIDLETCAALLESFEGEEVSDANSLVRQKRIDMLLDRCDLAKRQNEFDSLALSSGTAAALVSEGLARGVTHHRASIPELLSTTEEACSSLAIRTGVIAGDVRQYDEFVSPLWTRTGTFNVLDPSLVAGLPWMLRMRVYSDLLVRATTLGKAQQAKDAQAALRDAFLRGLDKALIRCSSLTSVPLSIQIPPTKVGDDDCPSLRSSEENVVGTDASFAQVSFKENSNEGLHSKRMHPDYESDMLHALDALFAGESSASLNRLLLESCRSISKEEPDFALRLTDITSPYISGKSGGMPAAVIALLIRSLVFDDASLARTAAGLATLYQCKPDLSPSIVLGEDKLAARSSLCAAALAGGEAVQKIISAADSLGIDRVRLRLELLEAAVKQGHLEYQSSDSNKAGTEFANQFCHRKGKQYCINQPWDWLWLDAVSIDSLSAGLWLKQLLASNTGYGKVRLALADIYLSIVEDDSLATLAGQLSVFLEVQDIAPSVAQASKLGVWEAICQAEANLSGWVLDCFEQGISLPDVLAAASVIHHPHSHDKLCQEYENYLGGILKELEALSLLDGGPRARAAAADVILSRICKLLMVLKDTNVGQKGTAAAETEGTLSSDMVDSENLKIKLRNLTWVACQNASGPRGVLTRLQGMLSALLDGTLAEGDIKWLQFKPPGEQLDDLSQKPDTILQNTCSLAPSYITLPTQEDIANVESATSWFKQALQVTLKQERVKDGLAALASILRDAWKYGEIWCGDCGPTGLEGGRIAEPEDAGESHASTQKVRPCLAHSAWMCLLEASFEHLGTTMACAELDAALTLQSNDAVRTISLLDGKEQARLLSIAWRRGNKDAALIMALLAPQKPLHKEAVKRALVGKNIAPEVVYLLAFRGALSSLLASPHGERLATEALERSIHDLGKAIVVAAATCDGSFAFAATEAIEATGTNIMLVDESSALEVLRTFLVSISSQETISQYFAQIPRSNLANTWQAIADTLPGFACRAQEMLDKSACSITR